ncbi:MAG: hypothetical protein Ta2A_14300 [Treponemataceae bacterium]|nr:MAG: hypothetical protein Ta2A_14300 [Treponemataceae bacterium]
MHLTETQTARLVRYSHEIMLHNGARNLVKAESESEIFAQHIDDCIAGAHCIAEEIERSLGDAEMRPRICDAGSGAGFPGIPLAVALPQYDFVLVEAMQTRSIFLESCVALLALKNVTVVNVPIEEFSGSFADSSASRFSCITFRAFKPLDKIEKKTFAAFKKLLIPQAGFIAAYKGKRAALDAELAALQTQPFSANFTCRIENISAQAASHERNMVILRSN